MPAKQNNLRAAWITGLFVVLAIVWRTTTLVESLNEQASDVIQLMLLNLLGFVFMVSGYFIWLQLRNPAAFLFFLYGLFYGLHWGGIINTDSANVNDAMYMLYLVITGSVSQSLLLRFSLLVTEVDRTILHWRYAIHLVYAPAAALLAFAALAGFLTLNQGFRELNGLVVTLEGVVTNGYFLIAVLVIWWTWLRASGNERREKGFNWMAVGLLLAITPYVASIVVYALTQADWVYAFGTIPYTLFFAAIPLSIGRALFVAFPSKP